MFALGWYHRDRARVDILRQDLSSRHADVIYHPTTHECTFIPPHLRSPPKFQDIVGRLDQPLDGYSNLSLGQSLTVSQFLAVWMRFNPVERDSFYFALNGDTGEWYMNKGLIVASQTALELLQTVITDVLAIVGAPRHKFIIDRNSELAEKLWLARSFRELRSADKLLKLRVELTLARLHKLERLHRGESRHTPQITPETLRSPTPELYACLYRMWNEPCLSVEDTAQKTAEDQRQALEADNARSEPFAQATSLPQANAEELHSGNPPPLRFQDAVEGVALFPTPNSLKQSVSLPNGQGAPGDTCHDFVNNSAESLRLPTILCSNESPGSQLSIDFFFGNVGAIVRVWWLHDPGGPCLHSHLPSFRNPNDLFCYWARQKAAIHSFYFVFCTSPPDEYYKPSGHILPDPLHLHPPAHILMEYDTIVYATHREWMCSLQPSIYYLFRTIGPLLQAWQLHDPGGPGVYVSLCLKSFWDLIVSLCYWVNQTSMDFSYPIVPFTGRSDKYCMPRGCIRVDLPQLHLSTHSFMEYGGIVSGRCLKWSPGSQLSVAGFCGMIQPVLDAQQSHDPGGPGAFYPYASVRPQILAVCFNCALRRIPLVKAFQRFQLRDNRLRFAWVAVTSVAEILKLVPPLISLRRMIKSLRSCARRNATTHRFPTNPTILLSDRYSRQGTQIPPHVGCLYQNCHNFVKSCRISMILVLIALLVAGLYSLGRTIVFTWPSDSPWTSSPSVPNIHVFTLVLCEYMMDRFAVLCNVQKHIPAFQRF